MSWCETDLQVVGRLAQFGTGAMEKIAKRMFADFAKNLEALIKGEEVPGKSGTRREAPRATMDAPDEQSTGDTVYQAGNEVIASLDVVDLVGVPILGWLRTSGKPIVLALVFGYMLGRLRGR